MQVYCVLNALQRRPRRRHPVYVEEPLSHLGHQLYISGPGRQFTYPLQKSYREGIEKSSGATGQDVSGSAVA